jgi:uncharacterized protein YgbK (DUF1537 family)
MARLLAVVIADDLTGAADSAAPFAEAGLATFVFLDRAAAGDFRVAAVDTDSRKEPVGVATARTRAAADAALRAGCRVIYKKVDSTLRGHVGAEVGAAFASAIDAAPAGIRPLILMCPAFPALGRIVHSGRVLVDGTPLPATPAALLNAAGLAVAGVPSASALGGAEALASAIERLADTAVDAIVCDAACADDLRAIAEAGARLSRPLVWVGSGGLARPLPRALGLGTAKGAEWAEIASAEASPAPTVLLVGSRTAVTQRQVAALARDENVETIAVAATTLLAGEASAGWAEAVARLDRALRAGRDVAIVIAADASAEAAEHEVAAALGRLSRVRAPIGALVATGGDTARAALRARGIDGYRLLGELETGVALGLAPPAEASSPLRIATKAGGFGTEETLVRCCASLRATRAARTRSVAT